MFQLTSYFCSSAPILNSSLAKFRRRNCLEDCFQDRCGIWRTAGNSAMNANYLRNRTPAGVALAENAAACTAVTYCDHQFGFRYSIQRALERFFHVDGNRSGHEQQVGMTRTGHKLDSDTFKVVVRIVQRLDLEFAAVAGTGVNVADAKGAAEGLSRSSSVRFRLRHPIWTQVRSSRSGFQCGSSAKGS